MFVKLESGETQRNSGNGCDSSMIIIMDYNLKEKFKMHAHMEACFHMLHTHLSQVKKISLFQIKKVFLKKFPPKTNRNVIVT